MNQINIRSLKQEDKDQIQEILKYNNKSFSEKNFQLLLQHQQKQDKKAVYLVFEYCQGNGNAGEKQKSFILGFISYFVELKYSRKGVKMTHINEFYFSKFLHEAEQNFIGKKFNEKNIFSSGYLQNEEQKVNYQQFIDFITPGIERKQDITGQNENCVKNFLYDMALKKVVENEKQNCYKIAVHGYIKDAKILKDNGFDFDEENVKNNDTYMTLH